MKRCEKIRPKNKAVTKTCFQITDMYVRDIQTGMTAHDKEPTIVKETAATALVEGNNVLGEIDCHYQFYQLS